MAKAKVSDAKREEARGELLKLMQPGDTVYTVLRQVSSSGMSRVIDLILPIMTERRFHIFKPTAAQLKRFGGETYVQAPDGLTWEERRAREDTGSAVLLDFTDKTARVRFNYGRNTGKEMEIARDRVTVIETREVPALRSIGWLAAEAMGDTYDRDRSGIKIGGAGMDMGFALVYALGRTLWPDGTKKPHGTRNGEPDRDGGYALNHSWL